MSDFVLLRLAVEDLEAASGFVPERIIDRIFEVVDRLARREFEGPTVTLRTGQVVHSWPVPPFRIYYVRDGERLAVLRVYHGAREPIEG